MSKRAPFKYPKWRLSSQLKGGAFVKNMTQKLKKNKILELHNSGFLMKLKFLSYITREF